MKDKIARYRQYLVITALIYSVLLVSVGILIGVAADRYRASVVESISKRTLLEIDSYIVEETFLRENKIQDCDFMKARMDEISENLVSFGRKLTIYEQSKMTNSQEYYYLKPYYFLTELKAYMLLNKIKKQCNASYVLVLYFYEQNDDDSRMQGLILDSIVNKYPERVHVFSFDINFPVKVSAVELLKKYYNVTEAPTVIVDEKYKFEGLTSAEKIESVVREELGE